MAFKTSLDARAGAAAALLAWYDRHRRDLPWRENMQIIARHRFSRYPLLEDATGERVAGTIHLKDLLLARHAGSTLDDLSHYVRPVQYVKPEMPALELFRRFRKGAPHLALVGRKNAKPIGARTTTQISGVCASCA